MEDAPIKSVGDIVVFTAGWSRAMNAATEPAMIEIKGAVYFNDKWNYFTNSDNLDDYIFYPEENIFEE